MMVKKKPEKTLVQQAKRATWGAWNSIRALWEGLLQGDENDSRTPKIFEHIEKRFIKLKKTLVLNW